MTTVDIDAIRARVEAATPGPWKSTDHYPHIVFQGGEENIVATNLAGDPLADGAFVAHAREDIPALLAEVDRLRARLERIAANATETAAEFDAAGAGTHARLLRAVAVQAVGEEA